MDKNELERELESMKIELSEDPINEGLDYFNKKISLIQGYKERVSTILSEAIKNKVQDQIVYDKASLEYDIALSKLLAEDPDISELKSSDKREAAAKSKLAELNNRVLESKQKVVLSDAWLKRVNLKYEQLSSVAEYLFKQLFVCQMLLHFDSGLLQNSKGGSELKIIKKEV